MGVKMKKEVNSYELQHLYLQLPTQFFPSLPESSDKDFAQLPIIIDMNGDSDLHGPNVTVIDMNNG